MIRERELGVCVWGGGWGRGGGGGEVDNECTYIQGIGIELSLILYWMKIDNKCFVLYLHCYLGNAF